MKFCSRPPSQNEFSGFQKNQSGIQSAFSFCRTARCESREIALSCALLRNMVSRFKAFSRVNTTVIDLWPIAVCTQKHAPGLTTASRSSCRVEAGFLVSSHSHSDSSLCSRGSACSMSPVAMTGCSHTDSSLALRSCAQFGSAMTVPSEPRLGVSSSMRDFAYIEVFLSASSMATTSNSLSACDLLNSGVAQLGSSSSLRFVTRTRSSLLMFGNARLEMTQLVLTAQHSNRSRLSKVFCIWISLRLLLGS